MSIPCTFQEFKTMSREFNKAAPTLNADELENAWKCLGLAYLGMTEDMWQSSAAVVLRMECRTYVKRAQELEKASERPVNLVENFDSTD